MEFDYDLIVIGAGSGGVWAARMAATYGAKVAIIEEFRVGGTCVIRGCVPKKLYVYAARFRDQFDVAESFGWQVDASFDWPTLVAAKEKEITRLEHAYSSNLEKPGVEIIRDRAVITGPNGIRLVRVGRELSAKYLLVATGARPFVQERQDRRREDEGGTGPWRADVDEDRTVAMALELGAEARAGLDEEPVVVHLAGAGPAGPAPGVDQLGVVEPGVAIAEPALLDEPLGPVDERDVGVVEQGADAHRIVGRDDALVAVPRPAGLP